MNSSRDEFYVGYQPQAPAALGGWLRRTVLLVVALGLVAGSALVLTQQPFSTAVYEWGTVRDFRGWIEERPYPALVVARPQADAAAAPRSRYLLVAVGKHGAATLVEGLDGLAVTLRGTLIYRDDQTMIEVEHGSVAPDPAGQGRRPGFGAPESLGARTLAGQIVDSKCFLGVMKPGEKKPHRACATRCISGGIPPVLLVRDAEGRATYYLLTGPAGETINKEVLPFVAEPVEIDGEVLRQDNLLILRADPADIRRVG